MDMAPVQEIIRLPDVVRVPLAPTCLLGLANLRGKVLPIVSLRRIFGFAEQLNDEATRAVVIDLGTPIGFVVDRVASVIDAPAEKIEDATSIQGTVDNELLTGVIKDIGGFPMVMVFDFGKLIAREFAEIAQLAQDPPADSLGAGSATSDSEEQLEVDDLQLVSFGVSGQEYAIDIADVQEIVQVPDTIVHVPNQPPHVLGLMPLRERLLPLVSLRSLFSLSTRELDEKCRVVVVALGQTAVGLVVDSVSEVLRVPKNVLEPMPGFLAREKQLTEINGVCRLDEGKRLVSVVSAQNMFRHAAMKDALKTVDAMNDQESRTNEQGEGLDEEEQVVVFQLAGGEFGVPIESVQEIVRVPEVLTHVPKAPHFVEGVINLRGTVLPVIDQRKRLDLPALERNDRQRIMVFLLDGVRTGFIVDAVTEVLKIPRGAIEVSPRLSQAQAKLLGRVAKLDRRMIQLIDPNHLLEPSDTASLTEIDS